MSSFDILGPDSFKRPAEIRPPKVGLDGSRDDKAAGSSGADGFTNQLAEALGEIKSLKDDVKGKAEALARGENVELHDLMISMGKSDVAFNMMLEVRNKLLEAWNTISRSAI